MNYKDKSLKKYLNDLAAKLPAPGGGSASAMNAAMGASLISMVVNFTLGKPKYARFEKELKSIFKNSEELRNELLDLVDLDILAYKSKNLQEAMEVPFMVCGLCFKTAKLCPPLINKGNINLISDVVVAAILLESAFKSACFNVEVNLKMLRDKTLTKSVRKELAQKGIAIEKIRTQMEEKVGKIIRG
jgi:methenyltetrahydrofolate cyclohydrolase